MQMSQYRFLGLAAVVSISLAGCMEGNNATSTPRSASGAVSADRDVENPNAFSRRETGLWDGRPSLGGVWVAHPDVRSPERVIIRNKENGQETIGALFRRERMNPGPSFQVSGEAANAIGILAGAPTMIEVIALRIEEAAPAVAEQDAPVAEAPTAQPAAEPAAPPPPVAPARDTPAQSSAAPADQASDGMIPLPEAEARPARSGGLFGRVFGRRQSAPAPEMSPDLVETQIIDDSAAVPAATASAPQTPAQPGTQASTQAPAPQASALAQPFIQLGIFSVEANARNAERMAKGAGLSARVVPGQASGNQFWRVVVGPASTQAEQRQMLARVKALGFNDAYAVRR